MSNDPRTALDALVRAFEEHLSALSARRGDGDSAVESAYLGIADAFEVYEDALYTEYDEVTPLEVFVDDEDDAEDLEDEDFDEFEDLDEESHDDEDSEDHDH